MSEQKSMQEKKENIRTDQAHTMINNFLLLMNNKLANLRRILNVVWIKG